MKKLIVILLCCYTALSASAQKFDSDVKSLSKSIAETVEKDARKFDSCMAVVEARIAKYDKLPMNVKNATELSVLHAVAGWMYRNFSDNYAQIRNADVDYYAKSSEHWNHVLDHKPELAQSNAKDYKALVDFGADGDLFNHDMLIVMANLYTDNIKRINWKYNPTDSICGQIRSVYESLGRTKSIEVLDDVIQYRQSNKMKPGDKDSSIVYWRDMQKKYAKSRFVKHYENKLKNLLNPSVRFQVSDGTYTPYSNNSAECFANKPFSVVCEYWNCKSASITIREYIGVEEGKNRWQQVPKETGKIVKSIPLSFGNDESNKKREQMDLPVEGKDSVSVTLPAGKYVFIYKFNNEKEVFIVNVSSIKLFTVKDGDNVRCYVDDALSGKPVEGASVTMRGTDKSSSVNRLTTNVDGEAVFSYGSKSRNYEFTASLGSNDSVKFNDYYYYNKKSKSELDSSFVTRIFLDRTIYRPGQTVHGYAITYYQSSKDVFEVVPDYEVDITCSRDDEDVIYEDSLTTNKFGSVDFSFTIPKDAKVGSYTIDTDDGGIEFSVEEYKRPTWELTLEPMKDEASKNGSVFFGDTVFVKGIAKSYSGVPVQGGKVEYTLTRSYQSHRFWISYYDESTIYDNGTLTVDEDGTFRIPMPLIEGDNKNAPATCFKVEAKVTDMAGETHEESYSLRIFKNEFVLDIASADAIDLNNESDICINAIDALENKVDVNVTCTLYLCDKAEVTKVLPANKPFRLSDFYGGSSVNIPVGTFRLKVEATDKKGHNITSESVLTVFDTNPKTAEKRRAEYQSDFFYAPCDTMKNGKSQIVYFCPATDNVELYMFQGRNSKITHHSHATFRQKMNILTVKPLSEDEDGCSFTVIYVKDGKISSNSKSFVREVPDEKVSISWSTFRDHLQPGQKETWKLKINTKDGKPMNGTEVLATMYDASLDAFSANLWSRINLVHRGGYNIYYSYSNYGIGSFTLSSICKIANVGKYEYDCFRLFDGLNSLVLDGKYMTLREVAVKPRAMAKSNGIRFRLQSDNMEDYSGIEATSVDEALQGRIAGLGISSKSAASGVRIRGNANTEQISVTPRINFAETAFFYPHLVTDKNGEVEISFTLPESLTKWKFLGFAHDKSMKNNVITAEAIAQKQFMVQPQMPRFIRVGDEATIATRIINQSDKALTGNAVMRLLNAKDESLISSQTVAFSVEAGKTTTVSFPLTATSSNDDIICEIVAEGSDGSKILEAKSSKKSRSKNQMSRMANGKSYMVNGTYSDGERNLIPVLPSRLVITESVPFYIKSGETKNVNLSGLYNGNSKTADEKTMNIEYTANPVWTVVEALHDIETPESPCATSLAASVYANTRLLNIASQMKAFTDKQIVNTDSVSAKLSKSWNDLKALQCSDGGFRWFPGFELSSYYITLSVAEQLVKIPSVVNGETNVSQLSALNSSLSYLDSIQVSRYEYNKAHNIKTTPSESDLHYLYVCSQCPDRKVSAKAKKIREEYLSYLEKNIKELSIYGMSSSSNVLRAFGHKSSAEKFVNTVRNYLVYEEGQGKHFESKRAQYSWRDYRIPTQVAAMNAIYAANPDDDNLNDMTLWLLRQKQVQSWDNPTNTVDVADLLLKLNMFGTSRPSDEIQKSSLPQMKLNNSFLSSNSFIKDNVKKDSLYFAEEMGYMNKQVNPALIDNSANSLSVISSPRGAKGGGLISWGAVTVSFTEDSENLKSYSTGEIKISRRMMIEEDGKWVDIKEGTALRVGQKIRVRHTLSTDRDMDYVRIKTLHPACFEPIEVLSGYRWKGGTGCYQSIHDSYIEMFFERFREGTSTLDLDYFVTRPGTYNMGVTSAECTYAPSFGGHSSGMKVKVNE